MLLIAAVLLVVSGLIWISPTFQNCLSVPHEHPTVLARVIADGACAIEAVEANDKFVVAISSTFIALFTLTLWWSTKRLGDFARQQSVDLGESLLIAGEAARAAEQAADAAREQAETARKSIEISNRPWVFTHPWPGTAEVNGNEIRFQMYLRCYGNAPATVVEIAVKCSDTGPAADTTLGVDEITGTNIGLAPDNQWLHPEMPADWFTTSRERSIVFGWVRYRDQFGVHTSRYCVRFTVTETGDIGMVTAGTAAWSRFD